VKINFESTEHPSEVKELKWKKTAEVRDQVFLAAGIPASRDTSKIISHT
jgi:hypothetical protein